MFAWRETIGQAAFAVTDRTGGVSGRPFGRLNLAGHVGDDDASVRDNRERVVTALGLPPDRLVVMHQVHGAEVSVLTEPLPRPPVADAMVTRTPGLVLTVLVADCVPVLLADAGAGVVGVAHAGRRGLVAGVVPALLAAVAELGARAPVARVGPSVCGRCYEVPGSMRDEVADVAPAARAVSWSGTPALDVGAGVVSQLAAAGVEVHWLPGCTVERGDLFSYRRDGTTGRFAGLAWLQP